MDFYAQRDTVRRKTGRLIVLFCLSLVLIVAALNAVAFGRGGQNQHGCVEKDVRFYLYWT